jgi:hypothetical protein
MLINEYYSGVLASLVSQFPRLLFETIFQMTLTVYLTWLRLGKFASSEGETCSPISAQSQYVTKSARTFCVSNFLRYGALSLIGRRASIHH